MFPIYLKIGNFELHTYGLMVAAGFAFGIYLAWRRAEFFSLSRDLAMDIGLVLIVAAMAGGRLLYVLLDFKYYLHHPLEIILQRGGFVFYGGLIAATLSAWIYLKRKNASFLEYADLFAPSVAIGHSLGRWGCFFQGCCFGKITSHPLGVSFPLLTDNNFFTGSPAALQHLNAKLINSRALYSLPVHPVQLYESMGELVIFFVLIIYSIRNKVRGSVFLTYVLMYAILRFLLEFLRADDRGPIFFSLSPAQWISMFAVVVVVCYYKFNDTKRL